MRVLLAAGANINATSSLSGRTPLMQAAFWGRTEATVLLIEAGADLDFVDKDGLTAVELAIKRGNRDTAVKLAAVRGQLWCDDHALLPGVQMVEEQAELLHKERRARSRHLIRACRRGQLSTVIAIVSNLRNLDITATDNYGMTALDYARRKGHRHIVALLEKAIKYSAEGAEYPDLGGEFYCAFHMRRDFRSGEHQVAGAPSFKGKELHPSGPSVFGAKAALSKRLKARVDARAEHLVSSFRLKGGPKNTALYDFRKFPGAVDLKQQMLERRKEFLRDKGVHPTKALLAMMEGQEVPGETRPLTVEEMVPGASGSSGAAFRLEAWLETKCMEGYTDRLRALGAEDVPHLALVDPKRMRRDFDIANYRRGRSNMMDPDQKKALTGAITMDAERLKARADKLTHTPGQYRRHNPDGCIEGVIKEQIFGLKFSEC